jgi:hypothetical protein
MKVLLSLLFLQFSIHLCIAQNSDTTKPKTPRVLGDPLKVFKKILSETQYLEYLQNKKIDQEQEEKREEELKKRMSKAEFDNFEKMESKEKEGKIRMAKINSAEIIVKDSILSISSDSIYKIRLSIQNKMKWVLNGVNLQMLFPTGFYLHSIQSINGISESPKEWSTYIYLNTLLQEEVGELIYSISKKKPKNEFDTSKNESKTKNKVEYVLLGMSNYYPQDLRLLIEMKNNSNFDLK